MKSQASAKLQTKAAICLLAGMLLGTTPCAQAEPVLFDAHPLEDISQTAVALVTTRVDSSSYANIEIHSQPLDERLRLRKCELPLEASVNDSVINAGRTSVSVRCTGATPWSLFVPVTVKATTQVVLVKGPLPRGTVLLPTHLEMREMPVDQLPANYLSRIEDVVGQELNRFVNNESYATAFMLNIRNMVEKGQEVVILARNKTLEVRVAGKALEPGSKETVSVS